MVCDESIVEGIHSFRILLYAARTVKVSKEKRFLFATGTCVAVYGGAMCWCLLVPLT
jgi:hypothetical protein